MKINNINLLNYSYAKNTAKSNVNAKCCENNMVSFSKEACAGLKALSFCAQKHLGETGLNEIKRIAKDSLVECITVRNTARRHVLNSRKLLEYATSQQKEIKKTVNSAKSTNFAKQYDAQGNIIRSFVAFNTMAVQDVVIMNEFHSNGRAKRTVYFNFGQIEKIIEYSKDSLEVKEFVFDDNGDLKSCIESKISDKNGDFCSRYDYKNSKLSHFMQNRKKLSESSKTIGASFQYTDEVVRSYQEDFLVEGSSCPVSGRKITFGDDKITYHKGWEDQPTGVRKKEYSVVFEKNKLVAFDEGIDVSTSGDEVRMGTYSFENDALVAYDGGHYISGGIKTEAGKVFMPKGITAEVLLAVQEG
ncbi:MAG: hypothetical protein IKL52_05790 [Candidatus Gastranaerophilales bacterium]|nr:hypothetical protein [Candidatus Gastranaerophilales bacterium]